MVTDPERVLLAVASVLDRLGLTYAVGGSLASGRYGEVRATNDVDVVVDLEPRSAQALFEALRSDFFLEEANVRDASRRGGAFHAIHRTLFQKVDFFVAGDDRLSRLQLHRRRAARLGPGESDTVYFTAAEDILLRKLEWFRRSGGVLERQWRDVLGVLRVQARAIDLDYLRVRALELGLGELLERALKDAGLGG